MDKGVSTGVCDACSRKVPREKLKAVKEQYHGEIISRGTCDLKTNNRNNVWTDIYS